MCRYLLLYLLLPAASVLVAILVSDVLSEGPLFDTSGRGVKEQVHELSEEVTKLSQKLDKLFSKGTDTAAEVGRLSVKVDRMSSTEADISNKLERQGRELNSYAQRIEGLQQAIGFAVRARVEDMTGLALNQVIIFDDVITNVGDAYDPTTGIFTAPASGTYAFYLQTLNHNNRDDRVFLDIIKNGDFLSRVHSGWSPFENGSTMTVTHLNRGDTVNVQVAFGTALWGGVFTTFTGFRISAD